MTVLALVDGRVHGVGADGAFEQLVDAHRGSHERPGDDPSGAPTPAARDDDHVDGRGRRGAGGGGRLEEGAGEVGHRVVVVVQAVGEGHALDAVHLHGPEQIGPNRARLGFPTPGSGGEGTRPRRPVPLPFSRGSIS